MSKRILHLSDIHIGQCVYDNNVKTLALRIANEIAENYNYTSKFDTIVVSGDIFNGTNIIEVDERNKQIKDALEFFNMILTQLEIDNFRISREDVIFCPGNHDVIRGNDEADFSVYIEFLKKFYGEDLFNRKFELYQKDNSPDSLISLNIYKDSKIAILSLNSACVSKNVNVQTEIMQMLGEIDFTNLESIKDNNKLDITKLKEDIQSCVKKCTNNKYLDYGFISDEQLVNMRRILNSVDDIESYTIIAVFHHHLQPFPEVLLKNKNDISIMKNASVVIEKLLRYKINIVLHGHKHMDLITPITNEQFIRNPEDLIYAISAGSVGKKDITNRMFQIIEVFSRNESRSKIKITKYKYNQDKCEINEVLEIPPKTINTVNSKGILKETLQEMDLDIYKDFINNLEEIDVSSKSYRVEEVIEFVENTIFNFPDIYGMLKKDNYIALLVLIVVHYRINSYLDQDKNSLKEISDFFERYLPNFGFSKTYYTDLINFIKTDFINNQYVHKKLTSDENMKYKNYTSFVLAATLITDIYMFLSKYTKIYFDHIKHKLNITVDISKFNVQVPEEKIVISSIPDRREVKIGLKCKDPSFHKVAVIIIKNIEENINRYEKQLGNIGLKLYHIKTEIEKQGYEQSDYNFEAYLPTLMKLLIGENLYKQREVFIRELIQNSYDAIMLRKKLDSNSEISDNISIEMRTENESERINKEHEVRSKVLTIKDNGIGMNLYNIERYFTGIGRSFYTSHDFDELKKNTGTKYSAISNFGIGFLSCFMVAEEIDVSTKYYEKDSKLISVNIPNFDGCFFVKDMDSSKSIGTTITLYEKYDSASGYMDFKEIYNYIRETFLDFPLDINVKIDDKTILIESFSKKKDLMKVIEKDEHIILHVFINEDGEISYSKNNNLLEQDYGMFIKFDNFRKLPFHIRDRVKILNSGIALQSGQYNLEQFSLINPSNSAEFIINYPPSIVQLDVARETINSFKEIASTKKTIADKKSTIKMIILEQIKDIFRKCEISKYCISEFYYILQFMNVNKYDAGEINNLIELLPYIYITIANGKLVISNEEVTTEETVIKIKTIADIYRKFLNNFIISTKNNNDLYPIESKIRKLLQSFRNYGFNLNLTDVKYIEEIKDDVQYNESLFNLTELFSRDSDFEDAFIKNTDNKVNLDKVSCLINEILLKLKRSNNDKNYLTLLCMLSAIFSITSYIDINKTISIDIEETNLITLKKVLEILGGKRLITDLNEKTNRLKKTHKV